jgi:hypothetical protein
MTKNNVCRKVINVFEPKQHNICLVISGDYHYNVYRPLTLWLQTSRQWVPVSALLTYEHWLPPSRISLALTLGPLGLSGLYIFALAVWRRTQFDEVVWQTVASGWVPKLGFSFGLLDSLCSCSSAGSLGGAGGGSLPLHMLTWCSPLHK